MNDLTAIIANNLAEIRHQRKLSLDKLSELSGVSKALLGQIERSESNPTVNTLWKIASGLQIPFNRLIAVNKSAVEVIRLCEIESVIDADGMTIFPQFSFNHDKHIEIFFVTLAPHCHHSSDPHDVNSEEYIFVIAGILEITLGDQIYELNPGDAIRFQSDQPHSYRNVTNSVVKFQNYYQLSNGGQIFHTK